ncbi:MAG: cell division protein ZapA [Alphaproteobacteria bacterium]
MAQVNVTISGRSYRIACEDGQEDHLLGLAGRLDEAIVEMRGQFGEIGDQRLVIMAAITMADRIDEMERRLAAMDVDMAQFEDARARSAEREAAAEQDLVRVVDSVTRRLETLAGRVAGNGEATQS